MARRFTLSLGPSNARLAAFAAPALPLAAAGLPLGVYLPPFYATELAWACRWSARSSCSAASGTP